MILAVVLRKATPADIPGIEALIARSAKPRGRARRGIGLLLLDRCEQEACAHGFTQVELMRKTLIAP
jgi:uncharacterized metal-binding protein